MKALHRPDLFGWSVFDEQRNVDFNTTLWVRPGGNIVIDPMPMSDHDQAHLADLGGAAWVVVTNSDHLRAARELASRTNAQLAGPAGERETWPSTCDRWLEDGDELVPGLVAFALDGSKTPGELALLIEGHTLVTGDLIRAHRGGSLMILPDPKLTDRAAAIASVQRIAEIGSIEAVIVGDGWHVFRDGSASLRTLAAALS
jgi:glyoxylase-like metal-dependent hydrolase (beta-lactamase superfamily II)